MMTSPRKRVFPQTRLRQRPNVDHVNKSRRTFARRTIANGLHGGKGSVDFSRMMRLTIAIRALRLEVELIVNVKHFVRGAKASHLFLRAGCARTARRDAGAPSEFHNMPHNLFNSLQSFSPNSGQTGEFYSLPQLEKEGIGKISR